MRRDDYDKLGSELTFEIIQETVAVKWSKTTSELVNPTRKREIVEPRQVVHMFGHRLLKLSLSFVGHRVGERDHSTVLHSCRTVKKLYETDKHYRHKIQDLLPVFGLDEPRLIEIMREERRWL